MITPLELSDSTSADARDVVNRVRFLLLLDSDHNSDNGIQISDDVRGLADNWDEVDFDTANLDAALTDVVAEVASVHTGATLPAAAAAETHFNGTLRCLHSGVFAGPFQGDHSGRFGIAVLAATGAVVGVGDDDTTDHLFTLSSTSAVSLDEAREFVSGSTSGGAQYSGSFGEDGSLEGVWDGAGISGTFVGQRLAGDVNADFRFAGVYGDEDEEEDAGVFVFEVDAAAAAAAVTGTAYSVVTGDRIDISGTVTNGTDLTATTEDGVTIEGTIATDLDDLAGATTLTGTWADDAIDGDFEGDGCRLN